MISRQSDRSRGRYNKSSTISMSIIALSRNVRGDTRRLWIETNALTSIPRGKCTLSRRTLYLTSVVSCWYRSPAICWNAKAKRDVTYTSSVYNVLEKIGETRGNYADRGYHCAVLSVFIKEPAFFCARILARSQVIRRFRHTNKLSFFSLHIIYQIIIRNVYN